MSKVLNTTSKPGGPEKGRKKHVPKTNFLNWALISRPVQSSEHACCEQLLSRSTRRRRGLSWVQTKRKLLLSDQPDGPLTFLLHIIVSPGPKRGLVSFQSQQAPSWAAQMACLAQQHKVLPSCSPLAHPCSWAALHWAREQRYLSSF